MPWVDKKTLSIIQLWMRCRNRQSLPEQGGLAEQSEAMMRAFDCIDAEVAEFRRKQEESERLAFEDAKAVRRIGSGD